MWCRIAGVILFAWWIAPARAASPPDTPPSLEPDSLFVRAETPRLTDIQNRERVLLGMRDAQCIEGSFAGLLGSARLRLQARPANIAVDSIAAMWVSRNQHPRGTIHGALIGLAAGGLLAWQRDDPVYALVLPFCGAAAGNLADSKSGDWVQVQVQETPPDPGEPCDPKQCLSCELERIEPGERVRVAWAGARYLEGETDHSSAAGISIRVGEQTNEIARPDIERLWVRRSASRKGAVAGVKVMTPLGAVAGGLLFAFASQLCFENCGDRPNPVLPGLIGALIGGATGAAFGWFVGAGLGAPFHAWAQLYP